MKRILLIATALFALSSHINADVMGGIDLDTQIFSTEGGDTLRLDVLTKSGSVAETPRPVVIFLSGGGFEGQARRTAITDTYPLLPYFVNNGFVGVAADYRCDYARARKEGEVPDKSIGDVVEIDPATIPVVAKAINKSVEIAMTDLFKATRYIVDNAKRYNADPSRIVVVGSSAGAITALTAEHAICNDNRIARKLLPRGFNYAAIIPMAGGVWNQEAATDTLRWRHRPCPMLMFHGDADPIVTYNTIKVPQVSWSMYGSEPVARQLSRMGVPHTLHTYKGMGHHAAVLPMHNKLEAMLHFVQNTVIDTAKTTAVVAPRIYQWESGKGLETYKKTPVDGINRRSYLYKTVGTDSLYLEVFQADTAKTPQPILFYCHGGGWQAGDRLDMTNDPLDMTADFVRNGYTVVSCDYRLGFTKAFQEGRIAEHNIILYIITGQLDKPEVWNVVSDAIDIAIDDTADALAFTLANAPQWGVDTTRVTAIGGSAGAITLLTMQHRMCNDNHPELNSRLPEGFNFNAIVSMAGGVWRSSTDSLTWQRRPCPMIMFHGDADDTVTYYKAIYNGSGAALWGSSELAAQLKQMQVPFTLYTVTGGDHAWSADPIIFNTDDIRRNLQRITVDHEPLQLEIRHTTPGTDYNIPWLVKHQQGL